MKNLKVQSGFSIVEALVYMTLTFFVLAALSAMLVDVTRTSARLVQAKDVHQNLRVLVNRISQDIKTAQTVVSLTGTKLELRDSSGNVIAYEYDSANKTVDYDDGSGPVNIVSDEIQVDNLSFTPMDRSVGLDLSLSAIGRVSGQSAPYALDYSLYVFLRPQIY